MTVILSLMLKLYGICRTNA